MRLCTECVWCTHEGVGYSEYTITGENFVCMLQMRPDVDDERPEEQVRGALEFAEECLAFRAGTGLRLGLYCEGMAEHSRECIDWVDLNFPLKTGE
jgi:hypothetical protein